MAPKPKIPPQYAGVAKKLVSEGVDELSSKFSSELQSMAGGLSDNLESRSVPLVKERVNNTPFSIPERPMPDSYDTIGAAGVFARTENGVTPDVREPSDFAVSMDDLLQHYGGQPKSVEGSGTLPIAESKRTLVNKKDTNKGVLWPSAVETEVKYTPWRNSEDLPQIARPLQTVSDEGISSNGVALNATVDVASINNSTNIRNEVTGNDLLKFQKRQSEYRPGEFIANAIRKENIPSIAAIAAAALALSSQDAEAAPTVPIKGKLTPALQSEFKMLHKNLQGRTGELTKEGAKFLDNLSPEARVALDEVLTEGATLGEVSGSGAMQATEQSLGDGIIMNRKAKYGTGVLFPGSTEEYTPMSGGANYGTIPIEPSNYVASSVGYGRNIPNDPLNHVQQIYSANAAINEQRVLEEAMDSSTEPKLFMNNTLNPMNIKENIPGIALPLAGAGVLLSSQNAEAAPEQKPSKIQLALNDIKKDAEKTAKPESMFERFLAQSQDQLQEFVRVQKERIPRVIATTIQQYDMEKSIIVKRAAEAAANWDKNHPDAPMSDIDKELMLHSLAAGAETSSPLLQIEENLAMASTEVKVFKADVLDPLRHRLQGFIRSGVEGDPNTKLFREYAPSLAVLGETLIFPLVGQTPYNVDSTKFSMFNSEAEDAAAVQSLPPEVQKLLADKTTLLGGESGVGPALLSFAAGYSEVPIWLIGGSSKAGLALGGAASEVMRDDGDLTTGVVAGVVGGRTIQKIAGSAPVKAGLNLLGKGVKAGVNAVDNALVRSGTDDMAANAFARIVARTPKRTFEPVAMMTRNVVNKLADDAAAKADTVISQRMQSGELKPQIIVLDVGEDGIPRTFGIHNGKVGTIVPGGSTAKTIITTRRAGEGWPDNLKIRDVYAELAAMDAEGGIGNHKAIQDWGNEMIPPDNADLVFAWQNKENPGSDGFFGVYKAGSEEFNAKLLEARSLVKVTYTGPDGNDTVGLGFQAGGTILAPDPSDKIPGAIPRDLVFTQTRIEGAPDVNLPTPENTAYSADVIPSRAALNASIAAGDIKPEEAARMATLEDISRSIKDQNALQLESDMEITRGGKHPNDVPVEAPPSAFDNLPEEPGDKTGNSSPRALRAARKLEVNMSLIPGLPYVADLAKAIGKIRENVSASRQITPVGKFADKWLFPATSYGEVFKIDAAIQQFSTRHFKRYIMDVERQLAENFGTGPNNNTQARIQFSNDVRDFITGAQRATPPTLAPHIQAKVNAFTNERNADYALIQQLGGAAPETVGMDRNPDLERMYALDYLTPAEWAARLKKEKPYIDDKSLGLISLTKTSAEGKAARNANPELFGKQKIERDMSMDYFNRKIQITQLTVMKELADNPKAASSRYNEALGHTKIVDFSGAGLLKGKFVDPDTYNAIRTFPKEQEIAINQFLAMLKYNKTVLNPGTWLMNIMGDVWGTMMSNIVGPLDMIYKMPRGIKTMRSDLAAYDKDLTRGSSAAADRVHESLKFGFLGAEFELNGGRINEVIDGLLTAKEKTWGERMMSIGHKVRTGSTAALGNAYSTIDMATKYGLYVNGLERWGIDLSTNSMPDTPRARKMAGKLLGHAVVAGMDAATATEAVKRAVARRIHMTLPMVDRTSPATTFLSKGAGVTNPWLRTSLELARINAQLPYRAFTEPGFAINMLKVGGILGGIYAANKMLRLREGISDEKIAGAVAMAPDSQKKYMGSSMATFMRSIDGGIIFVDASKGLVEALQWFKGDDKDSMGKRVAVNLSDTVMHGGVAENEYNDIMAKVGLRDPERNFNTPIWKQDDWQRGAMDMMSRLGPAVINNGWNLYNTSQLPPRRNEVRRPIDVVVARALGLPVESWGTPEQMRAKMKDYRMQSFEAQKEIRSVSKQKDGSSTGPFQPVFNKQEAKAKIRLKKAEIREKKKELIKLNK